jgi:DNA-directed RNA polymerase subunit RPC12/RpoP
MANLLPVYPARHPEFHAKCVDCGKVKASPTLYADLDGTAFNAYVCSACAFTFHLVNDTHEQECARDLRELKSYGSFSA